MSVFTPCCKFADVFNDINQENGVNIYHSALFYLCLVTNCITFAVQTEQNGLSLNRKSSNCK